MVSRCFSLGACLVVDFIEVCALTAVWCFDTVSLAIGRASAVIPVGFLLGKLYKPDVTAEKLTSYVIAFTVCMMISWNFPYTIFNDNCSRQWFSETDPVVLPVWPVICNAAGRRNLVVMNLNAAVHFCIKLKVMNVFNRLCPDVHFLSEAVARFEFLCASCVEWSAMWTERVITCLENLEMEMTEFNSCQRSVRGDIL